MRSPIFLHRQAADAPVFQIHLVDDHEGGGGVLVEDADQEIGHAGDEFGLLLVGSTSRVILMFT
jgi:hypothetical protein